MTDAAASLTGIWQGLYTYDWGQEEGFVATLLQIGDAISGTTHETVSWDGGPSRLLTALVGGRRSGSQVSFSKTYNGGPGYDHSVHYDGRLNADGDEIEGTWRIPPMAPLYEAFHGRFLMIRQRPRETAVQRRVAAKV